MHWKRNPLPKRGDTRTITRFALIPVRCDEMHWHWFEIVKLEQYLDDWRDWEPRKRVGFKPVYNCPDKKE